jgi:hypothetical protein
MAAVNMMFTNTSLDKVSRADVVVLAYIYHVRCVLFDGLLTSLCVSLFPEIVELVPDSSSVSEPNGGAP